MRFAKHRFRIRKEAQIQRLAIEKGKIDGGAAPRRPATA